MNTIQQMQIQDEANKIIHFNPKARKCGGNKLNRKCNCYGLTLKYIFSVRGLSYKDVGTIIGVTPQSINHLVNRASEESFSDEQYMKYLCKKLNVDYQYFKDLAECVRNIM